MDDESSVRTLSTVETTFAIIEALQTLKGAGVTELADYLNRSKGGVYNHLATLKQQEYVVNEDGTYRLSYRFLNKGMYVRNRSELYNASRPELEQLAEITGEYANLMIEEFGRGIYLEKIPGQKGISQEFHAKSFEKPHHLHYSSTGKAILAALPNERVDQIINRHGLPKQTRQSIDRRDNLFSALDKIREREYSFNDEEEVIGARAVGAAITDAQDNVLGAISVSGPKSRITDERFYDTLPERVTETANVIEVVIETSDTIPMA